MSSDTTASLIRSIESAAEAERGEIVARAQREAEEILSAARAEAKRILAREPPATVAPPGDPRLAAAKEKSLALYADRVSELRRGTLRELGEMPETLRHRLLLDALAEVMRGLAPGVYRVEADEQMWSAISGWSGFPPGRSLRRAQLRQQEVPLPGIILHSEDGTLRVEPSLEGMVERYFITEGPRIAKALLGDGFA